MLVITSIASVSVFLHMLCTGYILPTALCKPGSESDHNIKKEPMTLNQRSGLKKMNRLAQATFAVFDSFRNYDNQKLKYCSQSKLAIKITYLFYISTISKCGRSAYNFISLPVITAHQNLLFLAFNSRNLWGYIYYPLLILFQCICK